MSRVNKYKVETKRYNAIVYHNCQRPLIVTSATRQSRTMSIVTVGSLNNCQGRGQSMFERRLRHGVFVVDPSGRMCQTCILNGGQRGSGRGRFSVSGSTSCSVCYEIRSTLSRSRLVPRIVLNINDNDGF